MLAGYLVVAAGGSAAAPGVPPRGRRRPAAQAHRDDPSHESQAEARSGWYSCHQGAAQSLPGRQVQARNLVFFTWHLTASKASGPTRLGWRRTRLS